MATNEGSLTHSVIAQLYRVAILNNVVNSAKYLKRDNNCVFIYWIVIYQKCSTVIFFVCFLNS